MNDQIFEIISIPTSITTENIKDLLCNAIEGGSNYWIETITRYNATVDQAEYRQDVPFAGGFLELVDIEDDKHIVDLNSIKKGLKIFQEKYPWHLQNLIKDNADAETGDVFLQCCVYGEVIYG